MTPKNKSANLRDMPQVKNKPAPTRDENPCNLHFFVSDDEYEFIARSMANIGIRNFSDYLRVSLLPNAWPLRLEAMRRKHRAAGIPDSGFWHIRKRRERE